MTGEDALAFYTVYLSPLDYPGKWVMRRHLLTQLGGSLPDAHATVGNSLEEVRAAIPPGLTRFPSDPDKEDPSIVECWV